MPAHHHKPIIMHKDFSPDADDDDKDAEYRCSTALDKTVTN